MDEKLLVRVGAVVFVALAIVVSAVELTRKPPDETTLLQPASDGISDAALRDELLRCQLMGNLPMPPKECLDAWSESRRRFLGGDPTASLPVRTTPPVVEPGNAAAPNATPSANGTGPAAGVPSDAGH